MRSWACVGLIVALTQAPAAWAKATFREGETISFSVGTLPTGYRAYWVSSRDGYLGSGSPFPVSTLSVGTHTITVFVYRTGTMTLVYRGSVSVTIEAAATSGPATAPGEFEPVETLLLGCPDEYLVYDTYPEILRGVAGAVRTKIYVDNDYVRYDLIDLFSRTGVSTADVTYRVAPIDTIWMRDYGPLFVKRDGRREVIDLRYYPGRDSDDRIPQVVAGDGGFPITPLGLYWEGGNYTSDGRGDFFATTVLYTANGSRPAAEVRSMAEAAFGGTLNALDPMENDGGTGHLDMFALWTGHTSVLLNRFPAGHINRDIMERHASRLAGMGYAVTRLDLADSGFSTYSNGVLINGVALVPTYARSGTDAAALSAYAAAGYRTHGIDCRRIIRWSGAIHCIVITIPR